MEPFSAGNSIFNLLQVLDDWLRGEAGNGRQRITDAPLPGLSVRGIGTIGLPLIDAQAKVIIEKSTQASLPQILSQINTYTQYQV